ncbi:hypothetical protein [Tomitella fengzijianii]|uniref:Uncharacterized protein n=1 Tax=Tomitella fengzijianii TaxID=2597660 RepID=A0A516X0K9_9ACTN|nr:hypothetical protein [Tomitella fengzijianii]QDQ96570.1 hypothetical protein FO059_03490 [Tomitella fengzijianii]
MRNGAVAGAALASALLAGFVLAGAEFPHAPRRVNFAFVADGVPGADGEIVRAPWEWLQHLAPGIGVLVAVGVCAMLELRERRSGVGGGGGARSRSVPWRVTSWSVALAGVVLLAVLLAADRDVVTPGADAATGVGLAVAAGVLLGASAQASAGRRWALPVLVGGAAVACVLARPAAVTWAMDTFSGGSSAYFSSGGAAESGSWWLPLAVAGVLILAAALVEALRPGQGGVGTARATAQERPGARRGAAVRTGAVVLLVAGGYGLYLLARSTDGWGVLGAGLALTVALFGLCGLLLGDDGGTVPAALATTVVAAPLVAEATGTMILGMPVVVAFVVLGVAAAVAGVRWPSVGLGFAVLAVVGIFGVVTFGDLQTLVVFRLLVTAVGGSYLLASCVVLRPAGPGSPSPAVPWPGGSAGIGCRARPAVLAAAVLFVTSAPAALAETVTARLRGAPGDIFAGSGVEGASPGVGVAMVLTVICCAVAYALIAVRAARPMLWSGS